MKGIFEDADRPTAAGSLPADWRMFLAFSLAAPSVP